MNCKTCEYPLWNLNTRRCPECGTSFLPSEFEFVPNSVQFCCPHCNTAYYGTGANGLLVPESFVCLTCANSIVMDAMVLRPADGVMEHQTAPPKMPWLERKRRGRARAWFSMVGMALTSPIKMMQATPPNSSVWQAWWFALITTSVIQSLTWLLMGIIFVGFAMFAFAMPGGGGGPGALMLMSGFVIYAIAAIAISLVMILIWGSVAHLLLLMTGRTSFGIARTYQAMCYSSGANALTGVPCLGQYVGWIWWVVSNVLAVKSAQTVSGFRASVAVLTLPILFILAAVVLYALMIVALMANSPASLIAPTTAQYAVGEVGSVTRPLVSFHQSNNSTWPAHAIELVFSSELQANDFKNSLTVTSWDEVPLDDVNLGRFHYQSEHQQHTTVSSLIQSLPDGLVAHRLGDYVFTYHGIDLANMDSNLWVVICSPDPDVQFQSLSTPLAVGKVDGTAQSIIDFKSALSAQNRLRTSCGLSPLPDPATVTHSKPATAQSVSP